MNLPNKLTITRLILVLVFAFFAFPYPECMSFMNEGVFGIIKPFVALIVYIVASITDAVDGHLARKNNLVTDFGKFLDPIADKLLVTAALLALCVNNDLYLWACLIILAREFIVSGIRMIAASKGTVIAAGKSGKLKMIVQTVAIITLLVAQIAYGILPESINIICDIIYVTGNVIMVLAVILTIVSGIEYVWKNKNVLESK